MRCDDMLANPYVTESVSPGHEVSRFCRMTQGILIRSRTRATTRSR